MVDLNELPDIREDVVHALLQREHSGEFDANSKHIALLLDAVLILLDAAISQRERKKK